MLAALSYFIISQKTFYCQWSPPKLIACAFTYKCCIILIFSVFVYLVVRYARACGVEYAPPRVSSDKTCNAVHYCTMRKHRFYPKYACPFNTKVVLHVFTVDVSECKCWKIKVSKCTCKLN